MPTLAEVKSKIPPLVARLQDVESMLKNGPEPQPVAQGMVDFAKAEGAALLSEAFLGKRMPGKKIARALNRDGQRKRDKEWDDRTRKTMQSAAAAAAGLVASNLDDVHARTLGKWRKSLRSVRTDSSARTSTLTRRALATLTEMLDYEPRTPRRSGRDGNDFPPAVVRKLAHRVGYRCSNPDCDRPTAGPSDESPDAATNVGEAAHIHGALPGSRRYLRSMIPAQRRSIKNGIWLCAKCARMIDRDEVTYTVDRLRQWKADAEARARQAVQGEAKSPKPASREPAPHDDSLPAPSQADLREMDALSSEIQTRLGEALAETSRQRVARANLQALAVKLRERGRNAHLVALPEGSTNCPVAFKGLALPLLVLYVDHVVVVLDDAINGLYCYGLLAADLDGEPLPRQEGWTRVDEPARAHLVVFPMVKKLLLGSMMVAR